MGYRPDSVVYVSSLGSQHVSRVMGYGKRQVRLYGHHDLGERRISRWQFDKWIRDRKLRHTESFYSCVGYVGYIQHQAGREKEGNFDRYDKLHRNIGSRYGGLFQTELERIEHTVTHH